MTDFIIGLLIGYVAGSLTAAVIVAFVVYRFEHRGHP